MGRASSLLVLLFMLGALSCAECRQAQLVDSMAPVGPGDRVLVTGSRGRVGRAVVADLRAAGLLVRDFDLENGSDVRDPAAVLQGTRGCAAVVHLAAVDEEYEDFAPVTSESFGTLDEIVRTNVGGTAQVLAAAEEANVRRLVFMSSVDVFGCFGGLGTPQYLPIDDDHPVWPKGAYAWSKLAGEELCAAFSRRSGVPTVCFRAPGVYDEDVTEFVRSARLERPEFEWSPVWEYGAFIDARDLAAAVRAALTQEHLIGHHQLLVSAPDITSAAEDALTLASRLIPSVPVRSRARWDEDPFAALIDSTPAQRLLAWEPVHRWRPSGAGE